MHGNPAELCEYTALLHARKAAFRADVQEGEFTVGGIMNPSEFFIHSGSGFIKMPEF